MRKALGSGGRLIACTFLAGLLIAHSLLIYTELNITLFILIQVALAAPIFWFARGPLLCGLRQLRKRKPGHESLLWFVVAGGALYSLSSLAAGDLRQIYIAPIGAMLTLALLAEWLERRAEASARAAGAISPPTGESTILRDGRRAAIPADQLAVGDEVALSAGGVIPAAGAILSGASAVDESMLTGISLPVDKFAGDRVSAGSVLRSGGLVIRVDELPSENEEPPDRRLFPRLSALPGERFTYAILGMILMTLAAGLVSGNRNMTPAILLAASPAAMALGVSAALTAGAKRGHARGIFFKQVDLLENAHLIDLVALDKTGTVTEGKLAVAELLPGENPGADEFLRLAASAARASDHPIMTAIVSRAREAGLSPIEADRYENLPGRGVIANMGGEIHHLGTEKLMRENKIGLSEAFKQTALRLEDEGKVPLFLARAGSLLGLIALADPIRPRSAAAVSGLTRLGIEVILLTGDDRRVTASIAEQTAITDFVAEAPPAQKAERIRELQQMGKRVIMVGEGEDDRPSIVNADVGVSLSGQPCADIAIAGDLADLIDALALAKATRKRVKQNLGLVFGLSGVTALFALGVGGLAFSPGLLLIMIGLGAGGALLNANR
ncbi:MAG: HAD-IC family P-type ATPase [Oscillospiraceae bacterium]|nr:HAD-IC family P-type ATPase [Oscillospiraceae bacterium]